MHTLSKFVNVICILALVSVLGFTGAMSCFAQSKVTASKMQTIIFVCEHGAGRSPIAAAAFNAYAVKNNLPYRAISKGLDPGAELGKSTQEGLQRDGVDITNVKPSKLTAGDVQQASQIVMLDCSMPDSMKRDYIKWDNIPMNNNYSETRQDLEKRIASSLIPTLKK